jgi:hypothetical protein
VATWLCQQLQYQQQAVLVAVGHWAATGCAPGSGICPAAAQPTAAVLSSHAGLLQRTSAFSLAKSKRITRSNWSKVPLSEQQLQYAACDAYAGATQRLADGGLTVIGWQFIPAAVLHRILR